VPPPLVEAIRKLGGLAWAALTWWLDELRGMIPGFVKSFLGGNVPPLHLKLGTDVLLVQEESGQELAVLALGATDPLPTELVERIEKGGATILVLPDGGVLRRTVDLPLSAERELRAAMSFEIDRQTPFEAEQVHHRYRILARDPVRKRLSAELAVVPRATIETALGSAETMGFTIDAILVEQDDIRPALDFMPRRQRLATRSWRAEPWRPIAIAAALLLVIGPGTIAWHRHVQADTLAAEVARQRLVGHHAQALRDEILLAETASRFLPDKRRAPRAVEIVDTLTRLLPDDSWVFDLDLGPLEVRIEGFAADVPGVIERLQAPMLGIPQLRSPVARNSTNSRDRFDLALPLKRAAP
jgi:general secretion pathway protein L